MVDTKAQARVAHEEVEAMRILLQHGGTNILTIALLSRLADRDVTVAHSMSPAMSKIEKTNMVKGLRILAAHIERQI